MLFLPNGFAIFRLKIMQLALKVGVLMAKKYLLSSCPSYGSHFAVLACR